MTTQHEIFKVQYQRLLIHSTVLFYYNSLKQDIYNDTFTKEELKTIQEQLIDNSEDFDQNFLSEFDSW